MSGEWITDANVALARELWDEGTSAGLIAKRIGGCSKDAVLGYAHRRGWPPHPQQPVGGRKAGLTRQEPGGEALKAGRGRPHGAHRRGDAPRVACKPERLAVPTATFRTCQHIEGSGRPWTMCGEPAAPRSPYCADHHVRVFQHPPRHASSDIY